MIEYHYLVRSTIRVTLDPDWVYVDHAGHRHRGADWPGRLEWAERLVWCDGCNARHDDGCWLCADCREPIQPSLVIDQVQHRETAEHYELDGHRLPRRALLDPAHYLTQRES